MNNGIAFVIGMILVAWYLTWALYDPTYEYASTETTVAVGQTIGDFPAPGENWRLMFEPFIIEQQSGTSRIELIWEKKK